MHRLFLFFLIYGFLTDFVVGNIGISLHLRFIMFNVYSLVESLFFLWVIIYLRLGPMITKVARIVFILLPFLWIYSHQNILKPYDENAYRGIYDGVYTAIIAVLSGFGLLKFSERNNALHQTPDFWFLVVIFFNCFCVFFIKNLLEASFIEKIWFVPNIINITSYLLLSIGYLLLKNNKTESRISH